MLEFVEFRCKREARWPIEEGEPSRRPLKRLRCSDWSMFPEDDASCDAARAEYPLVQLQDTESFPRPFCRHCDDCTFIYEREWMEADFHTEIQTEFGPVHAYAAEGYDRCDECVFKRCDCDRPVVFAIRAVPSPLVLSLDFRYAPGQSLTVFANAISGREVGRLVLDLQRPETTDLDSRKLRRLGKRWAEEAGLLQSSQQKIELVIGLRLLQASSTTVLWSEEAERSPPRFRLRSKTNLQALRWRRYMEALCQPSVRAALDVRPEDMA